MQSQRKALYMRMAWMRGFEYKIINKMSQCMRFPTMWYVRPAKPPISLRIRAVISEPSVVA